MKLVQENVDPFRQSGEYQDSLGQFQDSIHSHPLMKIDKRVQMRYDRMADNAWGKFQSIWKLQSQKLGDVF